MEIGFGENSLFIACIFKDSARDTSFFYYLNMTVSIPKGKFQRVFCESKGLERFQQIQ